jgi:hypothetical protein
MAIECTYTKQTKPAVITLGRFQPATSGHVKMIHEMITRNADKVPVIGIIKGSLSGQNKDVNPFDYDTQIEMLKKSLNMDILVLQLSSGFLVDVINSVRQHGFEPEVLAIGKDREDTFTKAISRYAEKMDSNIKIMTVDRQTDDISATSVRNAIKSNDFETFRSLTTNLTEEDFIKLKKLLS